MPEPDRVTDFVLKHAFEDAASDLHAKRVALKTHSLHFFGEAIERIVGKFSHVDILFGQHRDAILLLLQLVFRSPVDWGNSFFQVRRR